MKIQDNNNSGITINHIENANYINEKLKTLGINICTKDGEYKEISIVLREISDYLQEQDEVERKRVAQLLNGIYDDNNKEVTLYGRLNR
ncbi:MAG: hypothetical protein RR942_01300 [Romboutsia sp.]